MRGALILTIVLPLAMGVSLAGMMQHLEQTGFESDVERAWHGPWGGGDAGGVGSGSFVHAASNDFVHSGDSAARLEVSATTATGAVAWACLEKAMRCPSHSALFASAWFFRSSSAEPLSSPETLAEMRVEYFYDDEGMNIIPTYAMIGPTFGIGAGQRADRWYEITLHDHTPAEAHSLKLSIVLMSQHTSLQPQAVWVDDVTLDVQGTVHAPRSGERSRTE